MEVTGQAADTGWLTGRVEVDADDFPGDNARVFAVLAGAPPAVDVRRSAGSFVDAAVEALVADGRLRRAAGPLPRPITITSATESVNGAAMRLAPDDPLQVVAANRALERDGIPWRFGALLRDTVVIRTASEPAAGGDGVAASGGTTAAEPEALGRSALAGTAPSGTAPSGTAPAGTSLDGTAVALRYRLTRATATAARDTGDVLASAGGTPWLVAGDDYVLVASPLTLAASGAPIQAAFVPWLRDLVGQRLGDGGLVVEAVPDDTITRPSNVDALELADGSTRPLTEARMVVPDAQGVYFLRRGARRVGALVVNPERAESRSDRWEATTWQRMVTGADVLLEDRTDRVPDAVYDRAGGRSIAWPLVLLALLALVAEALVARGVFAPRSADAVAATA